MTRYANPNTTTLASALAEMWLVCRAIWRDYRDCARACRRLAADRRYVVPTTRALATRWQDDGLHLLAVALVMVGAVVIVATDLWPSVLGLLASVGQWLANAEPWFGDVARVL